MDESTESTLTQEQTTANASADGPIYPEGYSPENIGTPDDPLGLFTVNTVTPDETNSGEIETNTDETGTNPTETKTIETPDEKISDKNKTIETPEPDYKALYEERIAAEQDSANREKYRETYQKMIDEGMPEAVAKMAAKDAAEGKIYTLENTASDTPSEQSPNRDFATDLKKLSAAYPDATEMPREVMEQYQAGTDLVTAYGAYRAKSDAQTIHDLREQIRILKQNSETAAKTPVGSVSGGGTVQKPDDPFLRGLTGKY